MVEIKLRPIEKNDLKGIHKWRNSESVLPYCRQYRPLSMGDMEAWYTRLTVDGDYNLTNDLFLMENAETSLPIGVGGFVRIDWRNKKAELSFYVSHSYYRLEEVVTSALLRLMEYGFQTLNLFKIYWPVYSFNPNLKIYEKVLRKEYVAPKEYYWNGEHHDRIVLVAYQKEFNDTL